MFSKIELNQKEAGEKLSLPQRHRGSCFSVTLCSPAQRVVKQLACKTFLFILLSGLIPSAIAAPPEAPKGWKWIVNPDYTDEFDGNALDTEKWHDHHPRWKGRPPARFMPENVSVSDGMLHLTNGTLDQPMGKNGEFTLGGAAVVSKKIEAHYGYYECRLKASSISMSSTFWFSNHGHNYEGVGRISQELDVLETVGGSKRNSKFSEYMNSNTHVWYQGTSNGRAVGNKARLPGRSDEEFNVYGCWWENANTCHFYLNDELVGTIDFDTSLVPDPFKHTMHLNMVTETYDWETPPTPEEINNPDINTTRIDYVRAYVLVPADGTLADWQLKEYYEEYREWTAANGHNTTDAILVQAKHGYVYLKKRNGKTVKIPEKLLCKADRELLDLIRRSE